MYITRHGETEIKYLSPSKLKISIFHMATISNIGATHHIHVICGEDGETLFLFEICARLPRRELELRSRTKLGVICGGHGSRNWNDVRINSDSYRVMNQIFSPTKQFNQLVNRAVSPPKKRRTLILGRGMFLSDQKISDITNSEESRHKNLLIRSVVAS